MDLLRRVTAKAKRTARRSGPSRSRRDGALRGGARSGLEVEVEPDSGDVERLEPVDQGRGALIARGQLVREDSLGGDVLDALAHREGEIVGREPFRAEDRGDRDV